jgi:hypothetical protein
MAAFFKEETQGNLRVSESPAASIKKPPVREVLKVFKSLPSHVADHYLTLMTLEKTLYDKKKMPRQG